MLKHQLMRLFILCLLFVSTGSQSTDLPSEIKLLTWNVLDDSDLNKSRGQSVLSVLSKSQADIVVLQEVNQAFIQTLKNDHRFSQYHVYTHQQGHHISGGLAILSKLPLKTTQWYERLPSNMKRGLLYLMLENKEQFLCIANVHLDSMMDDTPIRIKQLKSIFEHLRYCDDSLLVGDFNFGQGEAEEAVLSKHYQDAWLQLKPNESGFTFNRELNERSDDNAFWFEKSRRLDRIYFSGDCLHAEQIQLTANLPDNNGTMVSDHFAVSAVFTHSRHCN